MSDATITWVCPQDGNRLTLNSANKGPGVPACGVCRSPMQPMAAGGFVEVPPLTQQDLSPAPYPLLPGMAAALARLDPDLQQEPEA